MSKWLILSLQIGGAALALVLAFVSRWGVVAGIGVHTVGDVLAIKYGVV